MKIKIFSILIVLFLISVSLVVAGTNQITINSANVLEGQIAIIEGEGSSSGGGGGISCSSSPSHINSPCYSDNDCVCNMNTCGCVLEKYNKGLACLCMPQPCETGKEKCACIEGVCKSVPISERCYSDKDCQDKKNWACAVPSGYTAEKKCNFTTGECYCDVKKKPIEVDYYGEFTLMKEQTAIIENGKHHLKLKDIRGVCICTLSSGKVKEIEVSNINTVSHNCECYYEAKILYIDEPIVPLKIETGEPSGVYWIKEGETKEFENSRLRFIRRSFDKATFVVYPKEVKERCYSDKDCKDQKDWMCAVPSGYTVKKKCNLTTNECYCDVKKKQKKPRVELFILTQCPYGIQAQKGIIPVLETLKNKIDGTIRFVHFFMHGDEEEQETYRQLCIREEQSNRFLDYLKCFLEDGDSDRCLKEVRINEKKLNKCLSNGNAQKYYAKDSKLSGDYEVRGSPTLVINGQIVSSARDSQSYLNTICNIFDKVPKECDTQLSNTIPSPGFGYSRTHGGSSGGGGGITGGVIEINPIQKDCDGCILNDKCLPIGYRTSNKYCDADKSLKNQKQEEKSCNNNFECKSNICVDGKCVSSSLIQKILNFFKKLFGL